MTRFSTQVLATVVVLAFLAEPSGSSAAEANEGNSSASGVETPRKGSVTATSAFPGHSATAIFSYGAAWLAENNVAFPVTLTITFPESVTADTVEIAQSSWHSGDYRTKDYTVQVRVRGHPWHNVASSTMPNHPGAKVTHPLPDKPIDAVRIHIKSTHDTTAAMSCGLDSVWCLFRGKPVGLSWITSLPGIILPPKDGRPIQWTAPYVEPITPETRTLTAEEAQAVLEDDWLFQADGQPTPEQIGQEIGRTVELAERLGTNGRTPDMSGDLVELRELEKESASLPDNPPAEVTRRLYLAVRRLKRRIMFKNPALDFSKLLLIDNPYAAGWGWYHEARHRSGLNAVPGGRLLVLDGLHPGGKVRKLAPDAPGTFWRPDLSFDARKVLFCFKPHDEKAYHLYEINVDGTGLRQLTSGNYDDLDPIYLPDGHLMFSSGRSHTYLRCGPTFPAFVLARCDADGKNIYLVSRNSEPDYLPTLLDDGRVIYTRWEYTDKALWRVQSLWTVNQDGTNVTAYWGNQSVWPDMQVEPRQMPGTTNVMFTGVGHHAWYQGCIGIIDVTKGRNFPDGLAKVTTELPWPESGNGPVDPIRSPHYHASGRYTAYKTPFPLTEEEFLVSASRPFKGSDKERHRADDGVPGKYRLYLMDLNGNRELIYEGEYNIWHAMPLKPRRRPPVQPNRVVWPGTGEDRKEPEPGALYSADVYQGVPGIPRGMIKYLRVLTMDPKTYTTWAKTYNHSGPAITHIQEDGVKWILGTAPVEEDGSVHFKVPPGKALHFQVLDEHYRALQTMRTFTGVMPGEQRGCVGCHESHAVTPPIARGIAMRRPPAELTPPPWGDQSIGYERLVQPVLDRYCGECHQGDGEAREDLDLTFRSGHLMFNEPYLTLVGPRDRHDVGIAGAIKVEAYDINDPKSLATLPPLTTLSYNSRLISLIMSGEHYDVRLDPVSLRQLIGWVDANCPYRGDPEVRQVPDPYFPAIEWLPVRPRVRTAPVVLRP